jgi:carbon monoxide dehydrogenase subunit G
VTRLREVRVVPRPLDEVFAFVSDFSTTAWYDPGVAAAKRLDPVGLGARFEVDALFLGRRLPMSYTIVAWEPPHRVVLEGVAATSRARDEITFAATDGGTRVDWQLELQLLGPGRVVEPLLRPALLRLGRRALDGLAAHLGQRS